MTKQNSSSKFKRPRFMRRAIYKHQSSIAKHLAAPAGFLAATFLFYTAVISNKMDTSSLQGQSVFDPSGSDTGLVAPEKIKGGATTESLLKLIIGWTNFILPYIVVFAAASLIYGGVLFVTAGGQQDKVDQGKKIIFWSIVGLVLTMAAFAIVHTLVNFTNAS